MDPAEEIVKFWLQNEGYFLQSSVLLPNRKQADILAIKNGKKFHIEVSVSINAINFKSPKELSLEECNKKFKSVAKDIEAILGKKFKKIYVRGNINQGRRDIREKYIQECKKHGVEVWKFENILKKVSDKLSTRNPHNSIIKAIQLAKYL